MPWIVRTRCDTLRRGSHGYAGAGDRVGRWRKYC